MPHDPCTLIHIGFQKAASTWLQQRLFPAVDDVDIVPGAGRAMLSLKWASTWTAEDTSLAPSTGTGSARLLSDENLCGDAWRRIDNRRRNVERLRELLPDPVRVLLVVRRQQDAIPSFYAQYVQMGGPADLRSFLGSGARPGYDPAHLEYDRVAEIVRDVFGAHVLTVVPMELISDDIDAFMVAVEAWTGRPVDRQAVELASRNPRRSAGELSRLRTWNRYVRRSEFSPRGLLRDANVDEIASMLRDGGLAVRDTAPRTTRTLESRLRRGYLAAAARVPSSGRAEAARTAEESGLRDLVDRHTERFAPANARLQELCDVPLAPLGYVL